MGMYELIFALIIVHLLVHHVLCKSKIEIGYKVSVAVPIEYMEGFTGRAFLMETNEMEPNFKTSLSVEAINGKYSCSLQVFLGGVKVWNSGHYSPFFMHDECVLELTYLGDLHLLGGPKPLQLGWRTATSSQGVQRLEILGSGNLALVDSLNHIKWQSFNFPTDVILLGQRLNVATYLTSFPTNSTTYYYSLEIRHNNIGLYLNLASRKLIYSYWEFKPSNNRNISFLQLSQNGLQLFNRYNHKIAQIKIQSQSQNLPRLRFLALSNKTGNLGLYFYSQEKGSFEAAFQALNTSCDLPLACKPYGICTLSNTCSYEERGYNAREFCDRREVEMVELGDVASVLIPPSPSKINISREDCAGLCIQDCKCVAALYLYSYFSSVYHIRESCFLYGLAVGGKQVEREKTRGRYVGQIYMLKVPKGSRHGYDFGNQKSGLKKWILIMVGVIDSFIILLILGGFLYYFIRITTRKNVTVTESTS
ncbi:D-mannose binding lectin protein with Apple-like carbohydrate-binding domain [Euphorbia peplus]|nr:D-mannose binding lectin protein with Apple-like carbohydrate-binding domain [Euphorbia peplus]